MDTDLGQVLRETMGTPGWRAAASRDGANIDIIDKQFGVIGTLKAANTDRPYLVIVPHSGKHDIGGAGVYLAVMTWARNNGKTLRPDPHGLTQVNFLRRTDAMISSLLRQGMADHVEPDPSQYAGLLSRESYDSMKELLDQRGSMSTSLDIENELPLVWSELQALKSQYWKPEQFNRSLLATSARLALRRVPALAKVALHADGKFYDADSGKHLDEKAIRDLVRDLAAPQTGGVGETTLRRAAMAASVLQGKPLLAGDRQLGIADGEAQRPDVAGLVQQRDTWATADDSLFSAIAAALPGNYSQSALYSLKRPSAGDTSTGLLDKALSAPFKLTGASRLTAAVYDKALAYLGELVPEKVKAGLVDNYGVDPVVTDRRAEMYGAMQRAARETATFVDQLRVLDRAQSRIAYLWATTVDQAKAEDLMQQLPAESDAEAAAVALDTFAESDWGQKFPTVAAMWRRQWAQVTPFFAYPPAVRKIIYTTNAIESMHMQLRKIVKNRGHFPSDEAAGKLLYLASRNIEKNWRMPPITWKQAVNQFAILFGERFMNALG